MTVLVTLEHAQLDDVVTVSRRAAAVGESSIYLRKGERLTVRELVEAALIQSANDAAVALAEHVGGTQAALRRDDERRGRRSSGLRDTHFANPDGLDAPGHYSSARDVTRLARIAMKNPVIRSRRRRRDGDDRRRPDADDLERPARHAIPGVFGVKTGPHDRRRLVGGRRRAVARRDRLRDAARQPDARRAERRPRRPAHLGARRATGPST